MPYVGTSGDTGVWCGERKIASIGVTVRRRVTIHGLAINCDNDLEWFSYINPCGLNRPVTSLLMELKSQRSSYDSGGKGITNTDAVAEEFTRSWSKVFGVDVLPLEKLNVYVNSEITRSI